MKNCLILWLFICCAVSLKAQVKLHKIVNDTTVYTAVEVEPMPEGGMDKFYGVILNKVRVPKDCDSMEIFHRIILTFIVEKDGSLTHFAFLRNTVPSVQKEILRVMKLAPKWSAGKQNNRPVRVQFTIPFQFEPQMN